MAITSLNRFTVPLAGGETQGTVMPKLKYRYRIFFEGFGATGSNSELTKQVQTAARPSVSFAPQTIEVYNSKINLCTNGANGYKYCNERVGTILSSGGLMLCDKVDGIDQILTDGVDCVLLDENNYVNQIKQRPANKLSNIQRSDNNKPLRKSTIHIQFRWKTVKTKRPMRLLMELSLLRLFFGKSKPF